MLSTVAFCSATKSLHTAEPINPAPPVTSTFIALYRPRLLPLPRANLGGAYGAWQPPTRCEESPQPMRDFIGQEQSLASRLTDNFRGAFCGGIVPAGSRMALVITGASSGLGAALARGYAAPGVMLGLIGRDTGRLAAV